MYKVLLVDDEVYVRKGLISLMDWKSLQYEICGEADNGSEAFLLIEELQPDLVVVDIRMPILDGLGLIERVKETGKHQPEFIIVSGYHDFSYAQQALRYNVSDYILKPVDEQEMAKTLRKIAHTLNEKRLISITGEKPLVDSVIDTLVSGTSSNTVVDHIAQTLHISAEQAVRYALFEVHRHDLMQGELKKDAVTKLREYIQQQFSQTSFIAPIHIQEGNYFGLIIERKALQEAYKAYTEEEGFILLHKQVEKLLDSDVTLYVGKLSESLQHISSSYKTSREALNYKFAEAGQSVIYYDVASQKSLYYFDLKPEVYNKLFVQMEEGQQEAYTNSLQHIFEEFSIKRFAPSAVTNALTRIIIGVINIIRHMDGKEEELRLLPEVLNWGAKSRPADIQILFQSFVEEAAAYMLERRGTQTKGNIDKVKQYIDQHFTENINLKSIAAKFYMNSVYLGQLFRKSYGVYFNDYLLTLRIEEAKKLLRQTDLRMYEIAEKVGFQNADYFVTQFEKKENVTPTDYRNKLLAKK